MIPDSLWLKFLQGHLYLISSKPIHRDGREKKQRCQKTKNWSLLYKRIFKIQEMCKQNFREAEFDIIPIQHPSKQFYSLVIREMFRGHMVDCAILENLENTS